MSVELPGLNVVDIRQPIAGDSFNWSGVEPTAAKKSLVFHHSASDAPAEDGFSIAEYHVNHNGWGGIGYHLVITRSDYPGRAGYTNPGAQIQYVGDLGTYRAHVANQNPGRVGICFVGNTPDAEQLRLGRQLVDFLIAPNNILPSINFYSQVTVHRLVPEQSTACPGDDYGNWLPYLQGGAEPFAPPPPPPVVPEPVIVPVQIPVETGDNRPEYERTWTPEILPPKVVAVASADVYDFLTNTVAIKLPGGTPINDIAGVFSINGSVYVRTKYSLDHNKWNGVLLSELKDIVPQPPQPIINPGAPVDGISAPPTEPGSVLEDYPDVTSQIPRPPEKPGLTLLQVIESIIGILLSPLRLSSWFKKTFNGEKK